MSLRIGILVFDQFDLIDAGGPYEVFLTASRLVERDGGRPAYDVVLISPGGTDVTAYGGMRLTGLHDAASVRDLDVAVVPGLIDLDAARGSEEIMAAVAQVTADAALVTSVCTGAFLLGDAGLLDGLEATTHWEDVDHLLEQGRVAGVSATHRWVDQGRIVTSGGLTSGLHMALHVVARLHGRDLAVRTARQLDLPWDPDGLRG